MVSKAARGRVDVKEKGLAVGNASSFSWSLKTFAFWSFVFRSTVASLLPVPGSRLSIPLKLCGLGKNGKELAHLHGGRAWH